jgi:phage terminase large subunit-like protein
MLATSNSLPKPNESHAKLLRLNREIERRKIPLQQQTNRRAWTPRDNQRPPDGDWRAWLILAGRGYGKTRTINEWANEQAEAMPNSRGAIIAATAADVRDVVVEGESGLKTLYPSLAYEPSKRRLTWGNGTTATLFSADEPDRLRGPQFHWAICDELAAWRYPSTYDMLMLGLRLGENPRVAIATTPRPTPMIRKLVADPHTSITRGTTYENRENLAEAFFEQIIKQYEGTRLGRQEIEAEILEDMPGALWTRDQLDRLRVSKPPAFKRIVVGVDPEATSNEGSAETGIIVAAIGSDDHGYLLDDMSIRATPHGWASQAIAAYYKYHANLIVYEANQGGEMVENTLKTVDPNVPLKAVWASQSKVARAEPISAKYEQNLVHHVGTFAQLEDQFCNWLPGSKSPDRLDAAVWALTELMLMNYWYTGEA